MKKTSVILPILLISSLTSCLSAVEESSSNVLISSLEESSSESEEESSSSSDDSILNSIKEQAIEELKNFVSLSKYRTEEQEKILKYIEQGIKVINGCKTAEDVYYFLEIYEDYILELKTDSQYKKEAYDNCKTTSQIEKYKALGYTPLFKDSNFKRGFRLSKTKQIQGESFYYDDNPLNPFGRKDTPIWDIAQWDCKYDFLGTDSNGGYTLESDIDNVINRYTSKGKIIDGKLVPGKVFETNSQTGELYIEQNGRAEYDTPRSSGSEPWPCILFQQSFDDNLIHICEKESIIMEVEYEVHSCTNYCGNYYNYNRHAAQLVWYVTLQNRTGGFSNPDYGKYVWFGLNLYDDRYDNQIKPLFHQEDAGTSAMMYNLSSTEYLKDNNGISPTVGKRVTAKVDVIPYAKEAMQYAKDHGFLGNTKYEDLYIGGTNFGYEIPGKHDISSTIYSINVFVK